MRWIINDIWLIWFSIILIDVLIVLGINTLNGMNNIELLKELF